MRGRLVFGALVRCSVVFVVVFMEIVYGAGW